VNRNNLLLIFREDGTINTPGFDFGGRDILKIIDRNTQYLILKKKGCMAWSGRGEQSYYPTEYMLCKIREHLEGADLKITVLETFEFGKKWHALLPILKRTLPPLLIDNEEEKIIEQLKHKINQKKNVSY
jgi:hypothetical protein